MSLLLLQFPISHFCEKSRWNLDAKGLSYEVKNLLPGPHAVSNFRRVGKPSVPVLVDSGQAIGDSTDIALYLEQKYPGHALVPTKEPDRARVLELEEYFDRTFGPDVRRYLYGQALGTPGLVRQLFFGAYGPLGQVFGRFTGAIFAFQIRRMYRIDAEGVRRSAARIEEAATRLERELDGDPHRYLVGGRLTLADIAAASLLAPMVGPPGTPWEEFPDAPDGVIESRGEMRARVAGRWVLERYARDRRMPTPS